MGMDRVETIKSWYKDWLEKIQSVHSIFLDTHGEDRVDLEMFDEDSFISKVQYASGYTISSYCRELGIREVPSFPYVKNLSDDDWIAYKYYIKMASVLIAAATITVYYPEVIIENEDGRSHTIKDFYTRVIVLGDGKLNSGPYFNRTSYTAIEIDKNYMHSHVMDIPFDDFTDWQGGCLGTGPINDTIMRLSLAYEWELWLLFVVQLDQYVHVESLRGVPYHYLSSLGRNSNKRREVEKDFVFDFLHSETRATGNPFLSNSSETNYIIKAFTKHFCENFSTTNLFIRYNNGLYRWGSPFIETVLTMSNAFIEWFNAVVITDPNAFPYSYEQMMRAGIIKRSILDGDKIVTEIEDNQDHRDYSSYRGSYVLTFKGERKEIEIQEPVQDMEEVDPNSLVLLNTKIVDAVINSIINTLNIEYGYNTYGRRSSYPTPVGRRQYKV